MPSPPEEIEVSRPDKLLWPSVDITKRRYVGYLDAAVDEVRRGRNPIDEGGMVALFATEEQRETLAKVQALMSLLEGHGNVVMTELGRRYVAGEERMARVLHQRRAASGLTGQMQKLFGLEQKMKQYAEGEQVLHVAHGEG